MRHGRPEIGIVDRRAHLDNQRGGVVRLFRLLSAIAVLARVPVLGIVILVLGMIANPLSAQSDSTAKPLDSLPAGANVINALIVDSAVRARLAEEWQEKNRYQRERGYCAHFRVEIWPTGIPGWYARYYIVSNVIRAYEAGATVGSIRNLECPFTTNPNVVVIHTHNPTSCDDDRDERTCVLGGETAWECYPSDADILTIEKNNQPIGVLQCDRNAFVLYERRR